MRSRIVVAPALIGTMVAAIAGCGGAAVSGSNGAGGTERPSSGDWRTLPETPGGASAGLSSLHGVRVGPRAVIVGETSYAADRVEAFTYDLGQRRWSAAPRSPLRWRYGASVVAAGRQAIVWGGATNLGQHAKARIQRDGAGYDPRLRTWRRVAAGPLAPRAFHSAAWTGRRMIVWGGVEEPYTPGRTRRVLDDGAAYNPASGHWARIASAPLRPRSGHLAVWTGTRMILWGGEADRRHGAGSPLLSDGAIYDPAHDSWHRTKPAPVRWTPGAQAFWTGGEMLVWTEGTLLSYSPAANRWRRLPPPPWNPRAGAVATWTGEELVLWGGVRGVCGDCYLRENEGVRAQDSDGVAYNPRASRRWRLLPRSPLTPRDRHAVVGLGAGRFMVWGGCCAGSRQRSNGALYRPGPLVAADVGRELAKSCGSIEATAAVRCPTWLPAPPSRDGRPAFHVANADFDGSDCAYLAELHHLRVDDFAVHPYHVWFGGRCRPFALRGTRGRWPPRPNERDYLALVASAPEQPGQRRPPGLVRPRIVGTTSVRGARALVLAVDRFPRGGLHGGHHVLVFNHGGDGYMVSLHYPGGDRGRPPTLVQLRALTRSAASMRPASELSR